MIHRMMTSLVENVFGDSPPIRGFYWCFRFEVMNREDHRRAGYVQI